MHPALGELLLQAEQLHHEADVGLDGAGLAQLAEAPRHAPVLVDHQRRGQHRGRPAQPHQAVHHHQPALAARYNTKYYEHLTI